MSFDLRPYQQRMMDEVRGHYKDGSKSVLLCSVTGSGKTRTGAAVVHGAASKRKSVLWLAHRRELITQASQTFSRLGIPHGTINGGYMSDPHALVQVASVQTVVKRLDKLPNIDLLVLDESHHLSKGGQWDAVFEHCSNAYKLGLTATPWRLDGSGLGHWYDHMVMGPSMRQLIDEGSLTDYKLFAPSIPDLTGIKSVGGDYAKGALEKAMSKPKLVGDAISHYEALCPGKRAIVFAAGIANSKDIAQAFRERGIPAEHVDGGMTNEERDRAVARFACGQTLILCNDSLFGEGFDIPAIEAVILLRPTQSLSLYLQMVGRALRPIPGKDFAYILDHAGNARLKEEGGMGHGLPDEERDWTLEDREKTKRGEVSKVATVTCPECWFTHRPKRVCPQCEYEYPVQVRQIEQVEGKLEEVIKAEKKEARMKQGRAKTLDELIRIGYQKGYKNPEFWARQVMKGRKK